MRVVILHAGALGDCVLTIHVAAGMRREGHHVTLAARSSIARWAAYRGIIDSAVSLDQLGVRLWKDSSSDCRDLGSNNPLSPFDRYVSFLGGPGDYVTDRIYDQLGEDVVIALDPRPGRYAPHAEKHIVQQWLLELDRHDFHIGLDGALSGSAAARASIHRKARDELQCEILARDPCDETALENLNAAPPRAARAWTTVVVHPGSGGRAKCCPLDALEMLVLRLKEKGLDARWMIGPDEMERDGSALLQRLERIAPLVYIESVEQAADFVSAADTYVGNDAGMTHVAALTGVRTIALFGPTDPRIWQPLGRSCTPLSFPATGADLSTWCNSVLHILEWEFSSRPADKLRADQLPSQAPG